MSNWQYISNWQIQIQKMSMKYKKYLTPLQQPTKNNEPIITNYKLVTEQSQPYKKQHIQTIPRMFNQLPVQQQNKSSIQSKREFMHNSRVIEEREKIKKSLRFSNMSQMLTKTQQSRGEFIKEMSLDDAQQALQHLLQTKDFITLSCCLLELPHRPFIKQQLPTLLPLHFLHLLVQSTHSMLYQPQIIAMYKCLTGWLKQFHQVVFQYDEVVRSLVREIKKLKGGEVQIVYLEVLEDLCPSYSKRWEGDSARLFGEVFEMLQNQTISFQPGLNILKSLSPFINSQLPFSPSIIHRLLEEYQKLKDEKDQDQLLQGIFLVLTKVIYYTENADIVSCWRMVQVVLHAGEVMKEKIVKGYYNVWLLLAKLVEKISRYEMCELSFSKEKELMCKLIEEFGVQYLDTTDKPLYQITTTLINHLLAHTSILKHKQFNPSYLYLLLIFTRHCHLPLLFSHFIRHQLLDFLVQCVDHIDLEICGLALEVFVKLVQNTTDMSEVIQKLRTSCSFKAVLETKFCKETNKAILRDVTQILDRLGEFGPEY